MMRRDPDDLAPDLISVETLVPAVLGLVLLLGAQPVFAQVPLELLHRVDGPGQRAFEGQPLPEGTSVLVLEYPADRPHTLSNTGLPRKELAGMILNRLQNRSDTLRLGPGGETPQQFPLTSETGEIVYLLARTPTDSLFESYVRTNAGFEPGFDAVQSGRMTMGPVVGEAARRYRAVFRVSREEAASASRAEETQPTRSSTTSEASPSGTVDTTAKSSSGGHGEEREVSSSDGAAASGIWMFLLGAVVGGLIGSVATWWFLAVRIQKSKQDRNAMQRELRKWKGDAYRQASGSSLTDTSNQRERPPVGDESSVEVEAPSAEIEQLRQENEELRKQNASLKDQIGEIKEYVERLRDGDE